MAVRRGRSERRGEEVQTALRVGRSPLQWVLANGKAPPVLPTSDELVFNVEPLSDTRTQLADFFSILLNSSVLRCGVMKRWSVLLLMLIGLWSLSEAAHALPLDDSHATAEQSCSFGMAKGEASQSCHVPFPTGCLVADVPGTDRPWTTISKGGKTFCRFDDKATDWKTKITGSGGRCKSDHCSVQFSVRFDCSNQVH